MGITHKAPEEVVDKVGGAINRVLADFKLDSDPLLAGELIRAVLVVFETSVVSSYVTLQPSETNRAH